MAKEVLQTITVQAQSEREAMEKACDQFKQEQRQLGKVLLTESTRKGWNVLVVNFEGEN